ncbi:MAG: Hsp20/alpha crystallin family protein [Euryarchaeota archaeon]|jgi:HSP20 family molecular chaperone IbpA|nr:Hsp20/alpha crystallin family protein [Euryarchaeota archaeon]
MRPQHVSDGQDRFVRRYEYDEDTVIAVDLGVETADASVDIIDGTAIVVIETPEGERQEEFDLPDDDARAFMRNGILTIEVST